MDKHSWVRSNLLVRLCNRHMGYHLLTAAREGLSLDKRKLVEY